MKKFRVYDTLEKKTYYKGFALTNNGSLYKLDADRENFESDLIAVKVVSNDTLANIHQATLRTVQFQANKDYRYIVQFEIERTDKKQQELYEGDILLYETGCQYVIVYGKYEGVFCPGDKRYTSGQGYVACEYADGEIDTSVAYPLSDVETLCLCIGTICEGYEGVGMSRTRIMKELELGETEPIRFDPKQDLYKTLKEKGIDLSYFINSNCWSPLFSLDQFRFLRENMKLVYRYLIEREITFSMKAVEDALNLFDDKRGWKKLKAHMDKKWKVIILISIEAIHNNSAINEIDSIDQIEAILNDNENMKDVYKTLESNYLANEQKFCYDNKVTVDWNKG